ncbi:MAG: hypothetical protein AB2A00_05000 [Myxococcota bacterium]
MGRARPWAGLILLCGLFPSGGTRLLAQDGVGRLARVEVARGWSLSLPEGAADEADGPIRARGPLPGVAGAYFTVVVVESPYAEEPRPGQEGGPRPLPPETGYSAMGEPQPEAAWSREGMAREDVWTDADARRLSGITWKGLRGTAKLTDEKPRRRGPPGPCDLCLNANMCCLAPCVQLTGCNLCACGVTAALFPCIVATAAERTCLGMIFGEEKPATLARVVGTLRLYALVVRLGPELLYVMADTDQDVSVEALQGAVETLASSLERGAEGGTALALEPCASAPLACQLPEGDGGDGALSCLPDKDGTLRCLLPPPAPEIRSF